jgi:hypothetical protein
LRVTRQPDFRAYFTREAAFVEGSSAVWFPIQDSLIGDLAAEAAPGDTVTLFLRWFGVYKDGARITWLYTVNEFATKHSRPQWANALAECPAPVLPR